MQIVKLNIDGNIGEADPLLQAMGVEDLSVSSQMVAKFLQENEDADAIEVEIRSNGGSVSHGFDIYDQLKSSGKKIITKGYRVNSIASVIFLAGDERYLSKNAEFVIHNPWLDAQSLQGMSLTADTLKEISDDVRQSEEKIFKFYSKVLKLNDSEKLKLKDLMDKDTDIGSELALSMGFAHGLIEDYKKKYKKNATKAAYTDLILAKYKSNNTNQMENVNEQISGLEKSINKLMNFFKRAIKNAIATLEDGTTVYFEGDTLEIGKQVWLDEEMSTPAPDGEHTLNDGTMIMVADGVVIDVKPVIETEEEKEIEIEKEEMAIVDEEKAALISENETLKNEVEVLKSTHASLEEQIANLSNELKNFKSVVVGDKRAEKKAEVKNEATAAWKKHLNRAREINNNYGK